MRRGAVQFQAEALYTLKDGLQLFICRSESGNVGGAWGGGGGFACSVCVCMCWGGNLHSRLNTDDLRNYSRQVCGGASLYSTLWNQGANT